jgi:hypothetical protein
VAFNVCPRLEVFEGFSEESFKRRHGTRQIANVDEIKMVGVPEPFLFRGVIDQEMDVLRDLCRLYWREICSSDGGIGKEGCCAMDAMSSQVPEFECEISVRKNKQTYPFQLARYRSQCQYQVFVLGH